MNTQRHRDERPHYDEEYGDTVAESMAEEFESDTASQVISRGRLRRW